MITAHFVWMKRSCYISSLSKPFPNIFKRLLWKTFFPPFAFPHLLTFVAGNVSEFLRYESAVYYAQDNDNKIELLMASSVARLPAYLLLTQYNICFNVCNMTVQFVSAIFWSEQVWTQRGSFCHEIILEETLFLVTNTQRLVSVQLFAKDSRQVVRQVHGGEGGQGPGGGCGPRTSRVHPSDKVGIL